MLRCQPVATHRLVRWAQPRRPAAIQGSAATRSQGSAAKRPDQFARTRPETPLRRYGHPTPAGPRHYRGRPLPAACRSLLTLLHRSRLFFDDLPAIHRRRESSAHHEVLTERTRGKRPPYYFHFQTGGWMTDDSARRYDTQVEVLFNGTANATRRQALPQLQVDIGGADLATVLNRKCVAR